MIAPILETARLRLRGHRAEDLPACLAMWSDPNVTRFIGGKPSTEQQTWSRLLTYVGHWDVLDYGYWVMETREGGQFVGEIGFANFKRAIAASMRNDPEVGFALATAFHGAGYASEALARVLAWGDEHLPSKRTVCMIDSANLASVRVAEKCGYRLFERSQYNDVPVNFFERIASS